MGRFLKALAALIAGLLLLTSGGSTLRVSPVELAAAPYRHDLFAWELSNIPDKWVNKLKGLLPWGSRSRDERLEDLRESFALGEEIRGLEGELAAALATRSSSQIRGLEGELAAALATRSSSQTPGSQTPGAARLPAARLRSGSQTPGSPNVPGSLCWTRTWTGPAPWSCASSDCGTRERP